MEKIELPNTKFAVAITKGREQIGIKEVDISTLPALSLSYIIAYGLKQSLNDAHASSKDVTEALAMVDKRFAKIVEGTMGERSTKEALDPVEAEALKMAADKVRAAMRAKGIKPAENKERVEELAKQLVEKDPSFREEAKRRIEAAKSINVLDMLDFENMGTDADEASDADNATEGAEGAEAPEGAEGGENTENTENNESAA